MLHTAKKLFVRQTAVTGGQEVTRYILAEHSSLHYCLKGPLDSLVQAHLPCWHSRQIGLQLSLLDISKWSRQLKKKTLCGYTLQTRTNAKWKLIRGVSIFDLRYKHYNVPLKQLFCKKKNYFKKLRDNSPSQCWRVLFFLCFLKKKFKL